MAITIMRCWNAMDVEQFNQDMTGTSSRKNSRDAANIILLKGSGSITDDYLTRWEQDDVLVIEGIHCLNEKLSYALPRKNKFKIYISALTQLNIDEHNRIPTTDGRLLRRMVRDARTRGRFCPGHHSHVAVGAPWGGRKYFPIPGGCRCHVQLRSGL